jgi:AcrR family transcriptional regulator
MPRINAEYREDAKKKIIAAAIEIVAEKGWDAATLEAIAQKVGVTKGALYAYFENREALWQEVLFEVIGNIRTGIETTLGTTDDVHTIILNLADLIFDQQKPYVTIFYQLPTRLPQDPRCREEFTRIFEGNRILIRDCLARKKTEGKLLKGVDPETASTTIIAITLGLRLGSLLLGRDSEVSKKIWIDSVERILLIG